jgi:hypothetical protein
MKALTVQQPWAWAIVHGGKDVENRTRNLPGSYRGPVAIHAGKREDEDGYYDDMIREALGTVDDSWVLEERLARGVIVGIVNLVSVHHDHQHGTDRCSPWSQWGQWHLVLANPRPLAEPVPCRGALGLWTVPPGVDDQVRLQLPLDVTGEID